MGNGYVYIDIDNSQFQSILILKKNTFRKKLLNYIPSLSDLDRFIFSHEFFFKSGVYFSSIFF